MPAIGEHLLQPATPAGELLAKAASLAAAERVLQHALPAALTARVRLVNQHEKCLVICVDTAATLTLLRFRQAELLELMRRKAGIDCNGIELSVNPLLFVANPNISG